MKKVLIIASITMMMLNCKKQESKMENPKSNIEISKNEMMKGTLITNENIVDVLEIQRVIDAQVNAYDNQDWDIAKSFMTDEFETTVGQEGTGMMKADDFLGRAKTYHENAEEFVTHHSNSGYRIFFNDKDHATAFARGVIIVKSTPAGEYEEGGTLQMERWNSYEYGLKRTSEGWKINKILITYNNDKMTSIPKK
ncbi:hypothetical protein WH52_01460 [Tenacibaculum holothuriorum]|uniref:SnoaL-like domain-containing protein n=1 Tax=Tenacibaculum holothuriorum TaxID=1635173 RepID=A0A1Y2PH55_9FLAO|nr:nuclear transport factor 2 family protein [Tenacibaculum holothuriorum]OSY89331.1 hypothetical protein WH52_01460 [Tenacibaculum holothuriorum]